jgi:hypothetical protein
VNPHPEPEIPEAKMRAVWSFWAKPFEAHYHARWLSRRQHLLSWVLSVETISEHFPRTALYTDDEGARLLVDRLRLPFAEVSTELNRLADYDPGFWNIGKLYTYRAQKEPFIHFDNDLFLFKPLPPHLLAAPVLAQNPEPAELYRPEVLETALSEGGQVWLPAEWVWYRAARPRTGGDCAGIFGGNHVEFIDYFSSQAIKLVECPDNRAGWATLDKARQTNLFEQYLLAACVEYHRRLDSSPFRGVEIRYVFDSISQAYHTDRAVQLGFTHMLAESKLDERIARLMEERVRRDFPQQYERCLALEQTSEERG